MENYTIVTPLYEAADNLEIIVLISWCIELGCSDLNIRILKDQRIIILYIDVFNNNALKLCFETTATCV